MLVFGLPTVAISDTDQWPNAPADKTRLMIAAQQGDAAVVAQLIANGADVNFSNANGGTALMYGALGGNPDVVTLLVKAGAELVDRQARDQQPLHFQVADAPVRTDCNVVSVELFAAIDLQVENVAGPDCEFGLPRCKLWRGGRG